METHDAILMIASSEQDANMYYATGFMVPDPFIFIQKAGRKILLMSDLEIDRAKTQSKADVVLSYSDQIKALTEKGIQNPDTVDVVAALLHEQGICSLLVPGNFGVEYADPLREQGFTITYKKDPFFTARAFKSAVEVGSIRAVQRSTEAALDEAINTIREATVKDGFLYHQAGVLTSEAIKRILHRRLLDEECVAQYTIVACGQQACDPHNQGSGPLKADTPIIIDVFPRSIRTGYYADITRTVVKGRASDPLKRVYEQVVQGQEIAFERIRDGVEGTTIHEAVMAAFDQAGYKTGLQNGRMQGFFHGTGHGVGLEIHEAPRISKQPYILKTGHVVTVEPGLYYLSLGGVRVEDLVVVTLTGCDNLTRYPKQLEV